MKSRSQSKMYEVLTSLNQMKWRIALKGILVGLVAGLMVVVYRYGMEFALEKAQQGYAFIRMNPWALLPWLALVLTVGWVIARLMKYEPLACGGGVPQVEGMLIHGLKIKAGPVLLVRYAAGLLAAFFGLSFGHEGPSIQIGAAGGQVVAEKTSKNKIEENYLITAGAAAGMAAAFNAPLSGIVFALEEVHRSFSPIILITATTAALTTDVVATLFFGLKPLMSFTLTPQLPASLFIWLLPLGIFSGLVGALLNKSLLAFQTLYKKLPLVLRPVIALALALPFGLFLPQTLGGGANLIHFAEVAQSGIGLMLLYLAAKFLFTSTSFGSGAPGGIFLPILAVGAMAGSLFGMVAAHFGMPAEYIVDFAVCGMAGALSGSVKAPVTSILLTAEMTGTLVHLFPVAVCSFTALLVSDLLKTSPIYEALLERIMENDGKNAQKRTPGSLLEVPVEYGSFICGKRLCEVELPHGLLIAGIHRGEADLVPNGQTKIVPGDYLVVLSSEGAYREVNEQMQTLCRNSL
ncbi:MAG TPA: ClC family H(+)/Cl(-) exchange transporter [Candidatus Limiplasma sp.]|nr:ClC family H(+)/Cl(-) exchange transporter [Candidatus Limiplasma sp.]